MFLSFSNRAIFTSIFLFLDSTRVVLQDSNQNNKKEINITSVLLVPIALRQLPFDWLPLRFGHIAGAVYL